MRLDHILLSDMSRGRKNYRLQGIQLTRRKARLIFDIVRDDPPSRLWRDGGQARLIRLVRRSSRERAKAEPRTDKIDGRPQGAPSTGFPVAIGAESHPFPFRTRKLSLLPPMVLRAQVRGRVGRCRGLIQLGRLSRQGSKAE